MSIYYVKNGGNDSLDGLSEANAWATINKVNTASLQNDDVVSFNGGDQFDDATLNCKSGITYNSYGTGKAILGRHDKDSTDDVVYISVNGVALDGLIIHGYSNSSAGIRHYATDGLIINNCEIIGGDHSHENGWTAGIEQSSPQIINLTITNNIICDWNAGIRLVRPRTTNIGYNEIYNMWRTDGFMDVGSMCIHAKSSSTLNQTPADKWDCQYTVLIHHNNLHHFDYVAMAVDFSRIIYEYNEIHHNLDERVYRGGVKHGSVGKLFNSVEESLGNLGWIFRYNYVHDLVKFSNPSYVYVASKPSNRLTNYPNGVVPRVAAQSNSYGTSPVYIDSGKDGSHGYDINYADIQLPLEENDPEKYDCNPGADKILSGQGYGAFWVHNNIFYNCGRSPGNRADNPGHTSSDDFREDLASYFVNNTVVNCGFDYDGANYCIGKTATANSPHNVINNILNYINTDSYAAIWYDDPGGVISNNIYTHHSGTKIELGSDVPEKGEHLAHFFRFRAVAYGALDRITIENEFYKEDYDANPNLFNDIEGTFNIPNIGRDGVTIPDIRIIQNSLAYNNGLPFGQIGQNTMVQATYWTQGMQLGKDPTGRSLAYDILGNLRSTNDIGAVGIISTTPETPTVATLSPSNINQSSAQLNGSVNPNGLETTYHFEWGEDTNYGYTTTSKSAGSGTSTVNVSELLESLLADHTYHYRIVATNSQGTSYGLDQSFQTLEAPVTEGIYTINLPRNLAVGPLNFRLRFYYSDQEGVENNHTLIDFDTFNVGNDDISDIIYYPGNFKLKFKVDGDIDKWKAIYDDLLNVTCVVDVFDDNDHIWSGYVDSEDVDGNSFTKTLEFTTLDQMKRLENYKPSDNPLNYNLSSWGKVIDIISDILTTDNFNIFPYIDEIVYLGSIEARYDNGGTWVYKGFEEFYANYAFYFSSSSQYENMLQLLKQILLNYNCIGYVGFDKKFYMVPRVAEGPQETILITKDMLNNYPEWNIVPRIRGLKAKLGNGAVNDYAEVIRGDVSESNKRKVEEITIEQPGGEWDIEGSGLSAFSGVGVIIGSTLQYIDTDGNFRTKDKDGNYTEWMDLWEIPVDNAWEVIKFDRQKVSVKIEGNYKTRPIWKYYQFDDINIPLRAAKASYDFKKDEVTLSLRESNL